MPSRGGFIDQGGGFIGEQPMPPSLLQMAQGIAPAMGGGGGDLSMLGQVGTDTRGAPPFQSSAETEPNYPANWQNNPAFFTWGGRGREFQDAVDRSYASGGADQDATKFLATAQRPKMAQFEGADLPSTNDWQLLPPAYRRPGFALQNGRIVNAAMAGNPRMYLESLGIGQDDPGHYKMSEGYGIGYPLSLNDLSIGGQKAVWPGDVRGRESFRSPSYPTT